MDELLFTGTDFFFSILPLFMIAVFIWMMVATFQHVAPAGRLKRGVCIWQETLSPELVQYLRDLHWDIHDENAFIRVEGQERLIRGRQTSWWHWRTSWPYVGYVNLKSEEPKLQYRLPLPNLLFLIPFIIGFFVFPLMILVVNHFMERRILLDYLWKEAMIPKARQTSAGVS